MSKKNGNEQINLVESNGASLNDIKTFGVYDTDSYQVLDGTASGVLSSALTADQLYRVKAYEADCWVKIGSAPSPASEEGMLMTQYDEITMEVNNGEKIGVIGGKINIVPVD
jgi:hypothetical protein